MAAFFDHFKKSDQQVLADIQALTLVQVCLQRSREYVAATPEYKRVQCAVSINIDFRIETSYALVYQELHLLYVD